jgi:transcriptional regulator with XRE-family HTH domain
VSKPAARKSAAKRANKATKSSATRDNAPARRKGAGAGAANLSTLARQVKTLRLAAGITMQELGRRCDISQSALSKIENSQLSPTYEKIAALAKGLGVDVARLFSEPDAPSPAGRRGITRCGEGLRHSTPQYEYEFLGADISERHLLPLLATIKAHGVKEFGTLSRHEGEEFVYVLRGEIALHTDFYEPLRLRTGDSCYFDSTMGHALVSAGPEDAVVIWVSSKDMPK